MAIGVRAAVAVAVALHLHPQTSTSTVHDAVNQACPQIALIDVVD